MCRCMISGGTIIRDMIPSRLQVFGSSTKCPAALACTRSLVTVLDRRPPNQRLVTTGSRLRAVLPSPAARRRCAHVSAIAPRPGWNPCGRRIAQLRLGSCRSSAPLPTASVRDPGSANAAFTAQYPSVTLKYIRPGLRRLQTLEPHGARAARRAWCHGSAGIVWLGGAGSSRHEPLGMENDSDTPLWKLR